MKLNKLITTAALAMVATPAFAANWIYVAENGNGAVFYYDTETMQRSGNEVTVWQRQDYSRDRTQKAREGRMLKRYNCVARTVTLISGINYFPNGTSESFDIPHFRQEASSIVPETMAEGVLQAVCAATAP